MSPILFGPKCLHEPYLIIHARHAEKYVVDYEKDGVKNRIYSPFEFRVAYHNALAPPEMKRKRNIYTIFLEPPNRVRPYEANMVGATVQAWTKISMIPESGNCTISYETMLMKIVRSLTMMEMIHQILTEMTMIILRRIQMMKAT